MTDELTTNDSAEGSFFDPAVTPATFLEWRSPRYGRANPEQMNNRVWEWLIRSRISAYQAGEKLGGPSPCVAGPGWCFDRFGQSTTELPDGRKVLIAGEHEDYYDPDFYIYNDVVVEHPDGKIDIFGYPAEVFPPTDFHSATLVGDRIIVIGSLGYLPQRKPGTTPVMTVDLKDFSIAQVQTSGNPPGWIHEHEAILEEGGDSILIRNGKLDPGGKPLTLIENIDDWRLHLSDWRWERLTDRRWQRWEIQRKDGKRNHLWEIQQAMWSRSVGWNKESVFDIEELKEDLGSLPDLEVAAKLFVPAISHETLPANEEEHGITRIKVEGVVVRYVADDCSIQITVEGELDSKIAQSLADECAEKLARLENSQVEARPIHKPKVSCADGRD